MSRPGIRSKVIATLAVLIGLLVGLQLRELPGPKEEPKAVAVEAAPETPLATELEDLFSQVAEKVNLGVIAIESVALAESSHDAEGGAPPPAEAIGSGFVIDPRGYILTNHHLVIDSGEIWVRRANMDREPARLVQSDPNSDLALLKIEAEGLPSLQMGESEAVRVGQWVLAIGNPFGLTQTVSAGIVSAVKRSNLDLLPFESFIQTDASINPGNSGGPLVNLRGEVIGINTAMYTSPGGGNRGIGFAVPIQLAKTLATRWMEGKSGCFLGVVPAPVDRDMAHYFGLTEPRGAFLARVRPGSPAATGGLLPKDLLLTFGPAEVRDQNHLRVLLAGASPDEPVVVEVLRQGRREKLQVVPREKEATPASPPGKLQSGRRPAGTRLLGISVIAAHAATVKQLGWSPGSGGMAVTEVQQGSAAEKKGLRPGDVIVEVNDKPVPSLGKLKKALERNDSVVMLHIHRDGVEPEFYFLPR